MSIQVYVGFIGSGKTCLAARFAYRAIQRKRTVYHNIPDLTIGEYVPSNLIGKIQLENCLYILDEAGIDFNSRKGVTKGTIGMSQETIRFLKLSGHYKCDFVVFSQAQDFDVTIRRLASRLYIIKKSLIPVISYYRQLVPRWVTDSNTGDPRIEWQFAPLSMRFVWLPRWWKLFDRYNPPQLPEPDLPYSTQ